MEEGMHERGGILFIIWKPSSFVTDREQHNNNTDGAMQQRWFTASPTSLLQQGNSLLYWGKEDYPTVLCLSLRSLCDRRDFKCLLRGMVAEACG